LIRPRRSLLGPRCRCTRLTLGFNQGLPLHRTLGQQSPILVIANRLRLSHRTKPPVIRWRTARFTLCISPLLLTILSSSRGLKNRPRGGARSSRRAPGCAGGGCGTFLHGDPPPRRKPMPVTQLGRNLPCPNSRGGGGAL
jgi:hypothetical protein